MRVSTAFAMQFFTPQPHRVHQLRKCLLWNTLPLQLEQLKQLLKASRMLLVGPHTPVKLVPYVLDGVHIRRTGRKIHSADVSLRDVVVDEPGPVRCSIVILKDGVRANLLQSRQNKRSENLVPVSLASEIPHYVVQGGAMMKAEATPDHDRASAEGHSLLHCRLSNARPHAS